MASFEILVKGFAREVAGKTIATSTAVLVEDAGKKIIVDPGMHRKLLLQALKARGLAPEDIDYVILTHYHLDHSLLAGIFENAKILDDGEVYTWNGEIYSHEGIVPGTDVKIIPTPGHALFHCSVLFNTEEYGTVAVAGDLWWWQENEKQEVTAEKLLQKPDPYVKNWEKLVESRKKILELADYIIPGHGEPFGVEK